MMKKLFYSIFVVLGLIACAENDGVQSFRDTGKYPIYVSSAYPSAGTKTRAVIDGGFITGDDMGIFVVDYDKDGNAGEVMIKGNRASNLKFSLGEDGKWQAVTQLYWADQTTPADFYGYSPFDPNMVSPSNYVFSISDNQSGDNSSTTASGYSSSDLLRACMPHVLPTSETVTLQYMHMMAGVKVILNMGTGFTSSEWTSLDKKVLIQNTVLSGSVNIIDGSSSVNTGGTKTIVPLAYDGNWRAIVFPQKIEAGKSIVSVTIDGQSYNLENKDGMVFTSGKMHQFTITVNRRSIDGDLEFLLADEAILPWDDDTALHEGLVREYAVAEVETPGTLKDVLASIGIGSDEVENLKVIGNINRTDFELMSNMTRLKNLNLQKALVEDGVFTGFYGSKIQRLIMPEKGIKKIDGNVLQGAKMLRGTLIIPEGVEEIGWGFCLDAKSMLQAPELPSTLKKCDGAFFEYTDAKCDFKLPEGIEEWRGGLPNATGEMYLPSSLKVLGGMPSKLTGTINIPQGCEIGDLCFDGSQCTSLILPEGMESIPNGAFRGSELRGELRFPSTLQKIGESAFSGSKISKVIFPENLKIIGGGAFDNCSRLSGTITIPKNVIRVPENCFNNCPMLTGVIFHKDVMVIDSKAFAKCNNLSSIVCEGEEPPALVDDAFLGVPKDNFTVEVPKGCVEKYRNARGWGDFKRISEYSNFVCRPAQVNALNNAHQENIVLNADGAWTATAPSWVTLSKTSGTGKTALSLTFQPLTKGAGNRTGTITFTMGNYTTTCAVSQYDYTYDEDACLTLQTAEKGRGVDIVFAGDGWDGQSISDGSYLDLVKYQTECFFAIEPYKSMRQYFNVYVTFPLSQEKGVNTMYTYVNNRFGTLQGISSLLEGPQIDITSSQLIMETDELQQYVVTNTPVKEENLWRTLVIAVPNSTDYEGNTVFNNSGLAISICPPSEQPYPRDTRGTIQHEAGGHGFGKLGDETITRNAFPNTGVKNEIEEKHRQGWYANLATTGKLSSVPWAEFIFDPVYSDYVDVFEGGYGFTRGIYRPEANSCMNYGIPYYNTPSRLAIYHRILDYAGESFSMNDFRSQDTFEWGATDITRSSSALPEQQYVTGNHHVPSVVNFRKMGVEVRKIREQLKNKKQK